METEALEREAGASLVDSCARPNHPMIDRLWPARLDIADLAMIDAGDLRGWKLAHDVSPHLTRRPGRRTRDERQNRRSG